MVTSAIPDWLDRSAFPFTPKLVDLDGGEQLSVTEAGQGPAVVFSHGTPTWSYEWRHLIAALSPSFRCIAPDHLGFGLSSRPPDADYRPEAHARRFGRLVETLGLGRYSLVVHDFGGPFALDHALDHPEQLEKVVIINSFAWDYGDTPRTRRMAKMASGGLFRFLYRNVNLSFVIARSAWGDKRTLTRDTFGPYTAMFPDRDSRERVLFALARSFVHSAPFFESLESRLHRLANVPVRLVWGMADTAFPPEALRRFQQALPHASVLELPEAGHWPHEEQPSTCAEDLRRFLELSPDLPLR